MSEGGEVPTGNLVKEQTNRVPVPLYDAADQAVVTGENKNYRDPALFTIGIERRKGLQEIQRYGIPATTIGGMGLPWAFRQTSPDVGHHYQAHGIAKGDPIQSLDDLLTKGIQPGRTLYSMGFNEEIAATEAFGAPYPKPDGGVIVVSDIDKRLDQDGIRYVVVGEEYRRVIDVLKATYPNVTILPWHDAPKVFTQQVNEKTGSNYPVPEITEENRPYYQIRDILIRHRNAPTLVASTDIPIASTNKELDVWE